MSSGTIAIWAMKDGDYEPTEFAGTATGLQAALDFCATGGKVFIGPGTLTGLSGVTMYANTTLQGSGMNDTILEFTSGTTAIRERTTAEGNASGGTGIWIKDIRIQGNGASGDGINLGNQVVGAQLNFNAGLANVHVRTFTSGTGMILRTNAVALFYCWSNSNDVGIRTQGGSSNFHGMWAEDNVTLNYDIDSNNDNFFGCHSEKGTNNHIEINGSGNTFFGTSVSLDQNATNIIIVKTGWSRNSFYNTTLISNSFTFSNLIYYEGNSYGTGSSQTVVSQFVDNNVDISYIHNSNANEHSIWTGARPTFPTLDVSGASGLIGNVTVGQAGATALLQVGQGGADAFYSVCRIRSGSTGSAEAALSLNQNGTEKSKLFFNGTSTYMDAVGGFVMRDAIGGTERARVDSSGLKVANLTSGKYTKAGASGLLSDGPTPLSGTKVYYVADSSGGAVTRKLTFTDGILTAET